MTCARIPSMVWPMWIPGMPDHAAALFLDFDGTLVDLAAEPDAIVVPAQMPGTLARLSNLLGGAVAVVSGRTMAAIDRHLGLDDLAAAGVHGAERRGADGRLRRLAVATLDEPAAVVEALCRKHPALRLERKPAAIALHYRQAPELEDLCVAAMEEAVRRVDGMAMLRGKQVVELKPRTASKAAAVRAFLEERPFRHRRPWFFGDDVTDESAFEAVQALGGTAVKVGGGETLATRRLPDPAAMRDWLARAVVHLGGG